MNDVVNGETAVAAAEAAAAAFKKVREGTLDRAVVTCLAERRYAHAGRNAAIASF